MSSSSQRPKQQPQFDDVVDLGSVPPPPGVVGPDVHAARTAIAALPTTLLEELRRVKRGSFTNEAPTRPGKDSMRLLRPLAPDVDDVPPPAPSGDLASALHEALSAKEAVTEAPPPPEPPPLEPLPPQPPPLLQQPATAIVLKTPPMPAPAAPPMVAPMFALPPAEEPRPAEIRIEVLVAITIVGGAALVFALLAIANRVFNHP